MSFAKVFTRSVIGLHAPPVVVEVHLSQGMPTLTIVGLPEAAVRESKDRVRSALINTGYDFPNRRLTINLAPADLPKDGARLDLPIAIGMLAASGQIDEHVLAGFEFIGELSLDGELRAISGVLSIARAVKLTNEGQVDGARPRVLIVPAANAHEAAKVAGITVLAATSLDAVCKHLDVISGINPNRDDLLAQVMNHTEQAAVYPLDLSDVKGQHHARRALEIAAAGGHSMLLTGPPGSGKTLMASRLPGILPPLTEEEALEVASIYSIAGVDYRFGERPHRACHHTISSAALVGGGTRPKPGEISLSHLGALFLDELPEFDRKTLETLRQPLESKQMVISRANASVSFPANFQLIAAMNPCPCGYHGDGTKRCVCRPEQVKKYQEKISGPLLDRIDLHIHVPAVPIEDLQNALAGESSASVRARVIAAHQRQQTRQNKANNELSPSELDSVAQLDEASQQMLKLAQARLNLSARSYHRILRVARTIADLQGSDAVLSSHLAEALSYRG